MIETKFELPKMTWMECSWCGVQAIITADPAWTARVCADCTAEVPREDWISVEDLDEVDSDISPLPTVERRLCGLRFIYELDLTLFDVDKELGEPDQDRAGWSLSEVALDDPDEFLEEYQEQLVDLLGGTSVAPGTSLVPRKAWYQSRLVLAAAWVEQRRGQRERENAVYSWKSLPYLEGVVLDHFTRRFLADLLAVECHSRAEFSPLDESQ